MGAFLTSSNFNHLIWSGRGALGFYDHFADFIMLTATALLILISYRINMQGDRQDFVMRYICLSLPISVKSILLTLVLGLLASSFDNPEYMQKIAELNEQLKSNQISQDTFHSSAELLGKELHTGWIGFSTYLIVYLYMFWRYVTVFRIASGKKAYV